MVRAAIGRGLAAARDPRRAPRIALALWATWAAIVWNLVLDHVIVMAGRAYITAAALADAGRGPVVRMDDYMRPAVTRGVAVASIAAGAIALVGLLGVAAATRSAGASAGRTS